MAVQQCTTKQVFKLREPMAMIDPPRWTYLPWSEKTCGERGLTASALVGSIMGCASLLIFTVLILSLFVGAR